VLIRLPDPRLILTFSRLSLCCPPAPDGEHAPIYSTFNHRLSRLINLEEVVLDDVHFCSHLGHKEDGSGFPITGIPIAPRL
jgi:hypothetical protein